MASSSPLLTKLTKRNHRRKGNQGKLQFWFESHEVIYNVIKNFFMYPKSRARITTTIMYSKNIHVSQCDGRATIFHWYLIITTILCRNNIHLCLLLASTFQFMSSTSDHGISLCRKSIHPFVVTRSILYG